MIIERQFLSNLYKNLCCGCSLELPHRGDSIEHPQHRFLQRNKQNYPLIIIKYSQLRTLSLLSGTCSTLLQETKVQLEKSNIKIKEAKEETQQIRKDCQAIIKTYQVRKTYEQLHEETCLQSFQPGLTQAWVVQPPKMVRSLKFLIELFYL